MNVNRFNLLPESEQKEVEELMQKMDEKKMTSDLKLVLPEKERKNDDKNTPKESWWQGIKRRRKEKNLAKLRQRGEVGSVKEIKHHKRQNEIKAEKKPELFADFLQRKQKTKPIKESGRPEIKTAKVNIHQNKANNEKTTKPEKLVLTTTTEPVRTMPLVEKREDNKKSKPREIKPDIKVTPSQVVKVTSFVEPNVNLVPTEDMVNISGPPWFLAGSIIMVVVAIWFVVGGVAFARVKKAEALVVQQKARIIQLDTIIKNFESEKKVAGLLQQQFKAVGELVDKHLYWTPFMQNLEEVTIPDVYYTDIKASSTNEVTLRAIAKNYEAAARQIRSFERAPDFVKSIEVNQAVTENQPKALLPIPIVSFEIKLQLMDQLLFLPKPE